MVEVEQVSPQVLVLNKRRYVLSRAKTKPKKKKRTAAQKLASKKRAAANRLAYARNYAKQLAKTGVVARITLALPVRDKEKLNHLCDITGYSMGSVVSALLSTATATQIRNAQPQSAVSQARATMLLSRANKLGVTP
jgi:hypothetical protein